MDRLEKAMEKARRQRESRLQEVDTSGDASFGQQAGHEHAAAPQYSPPPRTAAITLPPAAEAQVLAETQLEQNRILAHRTRSAEADIFRILRTQVLQIMEKSNFRTLAITSPHYGDGKTTVALNLAFSIALDLKQTVLLVDLDLRKPSMHQFLGIEPVAGLRDYLLHDTPVSDCLTRLSFDRMSVLPAGRPLENSSEVLGSPKMAALARELKSRYADRIVIYDMPPVLAQDDSIAFLPHVDATLMVVRDGVTKTSEVKSCLNLLAGANVIGTVLNNSADR